MECGAHTENLWLPYSVRSLRTAPAGACGVQCRSLCHVARPLWWRDSWWYVVFGWWLVGSCDYVCMVDVNSTGNSPKMYDIFWGCEWVGLVRSVMIVRELDWIGFWMVVHTLICCYYWVALEMEWYPSYRVSFSGTWIVPVVKEVLIFGWTEGEV